MKKRPKKVRKVDLRKIDPGAHPLCEDKETAQSRTRELQKTMYDLLYLMFAHNRYSLLIVLHGIDTAGKDGTVRHIFSGANPQGIRVFSFKKPTTEESRHDFLWRCHRHTPESGLATIFNRSYYEEVTTVMVYPEYLDEQRIPDELKERPDFFESRFESINAFEKLLAEKGTVVIKLFLHISKNEQRKRIKERLENRSKNWKFSAADIKERRHWDRYMDVFEKMLTRTSTPYAPWTVVPADDKWYRDYVVSKTIVERLERLAMSFPRAKRQNLSVR
ncbi:MAG: polyphosphate kinase 2 family protein [Bdellovibrionales bacterium]|nr:polyphosphate kinase 2 family protein [Bdellovibrionales bacterium]